MSLDVSLAHYQALACLMLGIGALGTISRHNALVILMSIELMLNAANLSMIGYAKQYGQAYGHVVAFFVMAIAAAEAAVGLSIILGVFRTRRTIDVDELDTLRDET